MFAASNAHLPKTSHDPSWLLLLLALLSMPPLLLWSDPDNGDPARGMADSAALTTPNSGALPRDRRRCGRK